MDITALLTLKFEDAPPEIVDHFRQVLANQVKVETEHGFATLGEVLTDFLLETVTPPGADYAENAVWYESDWEDEFQVLTTLADRSPVN